MEVFLSIVGCGAGGRELRLRCLEPLTWVLGKKCWHKPMATCASAAGGSIVAATAAAAAAVAIGKRECVCVCKSCYAKMADYTV